MSNEHITDEQIITEAARHFGEMHVENCGLGDIKSFARAILALRPAAQPVSAPAVEQAYECERCGMDRSEHTSAYWCDNQSFRPTDSAPAAQPAVVPSKYGSPELQAMIVAHAAQPVGEPVKALLPERETPEMHNAVMAVLYKGVGRCDTDKLWQAYRSVLTTPQPVAVPDRVPMTDEQRSLIIERAVDKTVDRSAAALYAICETERLYGITTPKADK